MRASCWRAQPRAAGPMMHVDAAGDGPHKGTRCRARGRHHREARPGQGRAAQELGDSRRAPNIAKLPGEQLQGAAAGAGRALIVGFVDVAALPDLLQHRAHHRLPARRARVGYRSRCSSRRAQQAGHAQQAEPTQATPQTSMRPSASRGQAARRGAAQAGEPAAPAAVRRDGAVRSAARASCLASVVRMNAS